MSVPELYSYLQVLPYYAAAQRAMYAGGVFHTAGIWAFNGHVQVLSVSRLSSRLHGCTMQRGNDCQLHGARMCRLYRMPRAPRAPLSSNGKKHARAQGGARARSCAAARRVARCVLAGRPAGRWLGYWLGLGPACSPANPLGLIGPLHGPTGPQRGNNPAWIIPTRIPRGVEGTVSNTPPLSTITWNLGYQP